MTKFNYPNDIPAIRIVKKEESNMAIVIDEATPSEAIAELIRQLPEDKELTFYDLEYRSRSDPGTYISVRRKGSQFARRASNHGWETRWKSIQQENLIDWLHRCRKYNTGESPYESVQILQTIVPFDRAVSQSVWQSAGKSADLLLFYVLLPIIACAGLLIGGRSFGPVGAVVGFVLGIVLGFMIVAAISLMGARVFQTLNKIK